MNNETGPYRMRTSRSRFETWKDDALNWCPIVDTDVEDELSRIPILEHFQVADKNSEIFSIVWKFIKQQPDAQFAYLDSCVFPNTMKFQKFKMQASGVDIGSSMLFASRIGFSGICQPEFEEMYSHYLPVVFSIHLFHLMPSIDSSLTFTFSRLGFKCLIERICCCRNAVESATAFSTGLCGEAGHSSWRGPQTGQPRNRG